MVNTRRVIVGAAYLIITALSFLRPYPATGADEKIGAGLAIISGPAYKLIVVWQQPYVFGEEGLIKFMYPAVLFTVWAGGLIWLFLLKKKLIHLIAFGIFWALASFWNIIDFGFSSVW
jgi:hypothetical protein